MSVRQSNKKVKTCPDATTTDCVKYVGEDIECLDVCYGDSLTSVQIAIIDKLCELVGETNVSSITLPGCLKEAWATNDPTILNFIQFLLDQHCVLQEQVDGLPTTNNPIFEINYRCCSETDCIKTVEVTVKDHLENIILCLCAQKQRIDELETVVGDVESLGGKSIIQLLLEVQTIANQADVNASDWISKKPCIITQTTGC